jgi:hypothetical protein
MKLEKLIIKKNSKKKTQVNLLYLQRESWDQDKYFQLEK